MKALVIRNLKLYFRDRIAVFFSLLTVFIIIALYVFFLGDMMINDVKEAGIINAKELMDSWVMAGLFTVVSLTTTLGALSSMVDDNSKKISNDFTASPLKSSALVAAYILSSFLIGMVMSIFAFVVAEVYLYSSGGSILSGPAMIKTFACMILSVLAGGSMVFFITCFIKSQSAFNSVNIVIGTLIGFLTGIYIPIGQLPSAVQTVIKLFPPSHAGLLFRQIMMEIPLKEAFDKAPKESLAAFKETMGLSFSFNGELSSWWVSIAVLIITTILFYGLSLVIIKRKNR